MEFIYLFAHGVADDPEYAEVTATTLVNAAQILQDCLHISDDPDYYRTIRYIRRREVQ